MSDAAQIARVVLVVALLAAAAAAATPRGRLPLALRGVLRVMRRDCGREAAEAPRRESVSVARRIAAVLLVLAAAAACLLVK